MKGKMAIIGDGDSVLVFKAVGIDAYGTESGEEARRILTKLAKEYQIIFVTDKLAKELKETADSFSSSAYPIILTLPSMSGSSGYGYEVLKREMERALGIDILFKDGDGEN